MRLFILGANGRTGAQLVDLALSRHHDVTAFVRSKDRITRRAAGLRVVVGDPRRAEDLARALPGHDAVLSALGSRSAFRPSSLLEECAASTTHAMIRTRTRRLVLVSAATLFPPGGLVARFFRWLFKHVVRDTIAAEHIVRSTSLDWTIARPPRLVHGDATSYRSAVSQLPSRASSISFRALAAFMLDAVEQRTHHGEVVGLSS
jgi:putative NADH-flavin reductase